MELCDGARSTARQLTLPAGLLALPLSTTPFDARAPPASPMPTEPYDATRRVRRELAALHSRPPVQLAYFVGDFAAAAQYLRRALHAEPAMAEAVCLLLNAQA